MRHVFAATLLLLLGLFIGLQQLPAQQTVPATVPATTPATTQPLPLPAAARAKHAVIISIDGCRPDVLLRAKATNIREMMDQGVFSFYAETTDVAITLPSHT